MSSKHSQSCKGISTPIAGKCYVLVRATIPIRFADSYSISRNTVRPLASVNSRRNGFPIGCRTFVVRRPIIVCYIVANLIAFKRIESEASVIVRNNVQIEFNG